MGHIKWVISVLLAILLISPHYMFSAAKMETVEVRITFPGLPFDDVELKMERAEAEEMVQEMERMAEKRNLPSIFSFLRGYANIGNFNLSLSDSNVTTISPSFLDLQMASSPIHPTFYFSFSSMPSPMTPSLPWC